MIESDTTSNDLQKALAPPCVVTLGCVWLQPFDGERLCQDDVRHALARHAVGDWGNVTEYEKIINAWCLDHNGLVLSHHTDRNGTRFWVITHPSLAATFVQASYWTDVPRHFPPDVDESLSIRNRLGPLCKG